MGAVTFVRHCNEVDLWKNLLGNIFFDNDVAADDK